MEELRDGVDKLRSLVVDPEVKPELEILAIIVKAKMDELTETITMAKSGRRDQAMEIVRTDRGRQLMDDFRRNRQDMLARQTTFVSSRRAAYLATMNNMLFLSLAVGIAAVALLLFTARNTSARLRQPIEALIEGIHTVAEGDLEHRVTVTAHDEIGRLADAFNAMADQALEGRQARDAVQAELERSNAELDSFAYVASHDLKAPLRGIRNLADWIAEDLGTSASKDTLENLGLLRRRVDRLDGLLESLLEYSRVGRRPETVEDVNTGRLVLEIAEYLAPREGFSVVCPETMPTFKTAKPALEKVLRNLIGNALKHHDGGSGIVRVSAAVQGAMVEFRVADDGPGIPQEFQEKVFQMFQTLKPRDQIEGSGMGLAIVKKTIEGLGGRIRVESAPPERGTTFIFTWPRRLTES
jgi:signal transduction histidine kinase